MAKVLGVMACPICVKEVTVKENSNKKPTLYCSGCRVQISSSGGMSMKAIMSQVRPVEPVSTPLLDRVAEKEEVKGNESEKVVDGRTDNGPDAGAVSGGAVARTEDKSGGFLRKLWSGQ